MMFQLPELGLLSLAMAIPLISGGLNLAIIATANQAALLMAWILTDADAAGRRRRRCWRCGSLAALLAGLLLCVAIGLVTGLLVAVIGVHPILVTLGTMTLIDGVSIWFTRGRTLVGLPRCADLQSPTTRSSACRSRSSCSWWWRIAVHVLLTRTPLGIRIHMIGSNLEATRYSGVDTRRVLICGLRAVEPALLRWPRS